MFEKFREGGWLTLARHGAASWGSASSSGATTARCEASWRTLYQDVRELDDGVARAAAHHRTRTRPPPASWCPSYGGVGIHTVLNVFRVVPEPLQEPGLHLGGRHRLGRLQGRRLAWRRWSRRPSATLKQYCSLATTLGDARRPTSFGVGTDAVAEAEKLCRAGHGRVPRRDLLRGQGHLRARERWYQRLLHNETALAIQKRPLLAGRDDGHPARQGELASRVTPHPASESPIPARHGWYPAVGMKPDATPQRRPMWRSGFLYAFLIGAAVAGLLHRPLSGGDLPAPAAPDGAPLFGAGESASARSTRAPRPARAGRRHRRRARARRRLRPLPAAARSSARSSPASCSGRRCSAASRRRPRRSCCPPTVAPFLGVLAQVGVILYMFLVGLELDPGCCASATHATAGHLARQHRRAVPAGRGAGALALSAARRRSDVPFTVFALFLGVSMSVTAFPVLARILTDRGMHKYAPGRHRAHLRRRRRRDRVVPAGVRGQRRRRRAPAARLLTVGADASATSR